MTVEYITEIIDLKLCHTFSNGYSQRRSIELALFTRVIITFPHCSSDFPFGYHILTQVIRFDIENRVLLVFLDFPLAINVFNLGHQILLTYTYRKNRKLWGRFGWLVGCFGLNVETIFQSISGRLLKRGRKKREMIDERNLVQTTPTHTNWKRSKPLPYSNPN